jgi:Fe-S-cluster-containing dehydrogenase component
MAPTCAITSLVTTREDGMTNMKVLIVDLAKCNGCRNCQLACKDEHCGNDWSPYALPQPMSGQFWCNVEERERGRVPVVRVAYTPVFCGHCDECPLLAVASDCVYRDKNGFVIIDSEKARGRDDLAALCPYGRVFYNEELGIAQKCTGCAHLIDGGWSEPRCVDVCATGALRFGDEADFAEEIARAQRGSADIEPKTGIGSHVYYLNVPKRWIAGTVADRAINEVIIGADVTICDETGNEVARTQTDWAGDFRFYECEPRRYQVHVHAPGYKPVDLLADCSDEDVVFDDIFVQEVENEE